MELPKGFCDLSTAYNAPEGTFVNIIGVVVDLMGSTIAARTGQHMLTFKLLDQRLHESIFGSQGLRVRFFKNDKNALPRVRQNGDVVLLRNVKITSYSQQPMVLSNHQTGVLVFPAEKIPDPGFEIAYRGKQRLECLGIPLDVNALSLQEQRYVISLKQEMSCTVQALPSISDANTALEPFLPPPPTAPTEPAAMRKRPGEHLPQPAPKQAKQSTLGPKFQLIEELQHRRFADICAQVVKKFSNNFGSCELYVTDYTQNDQMFLYTAPEEETEHERDGDTFGHIGPPKREWPGPYGWLVLKINVKDPHSYYVNKEVNEGDFVLLKNVKMKIMNEHAKLEGDMWPDTINPEKVQILKLGSHDVPEIKAILSRKERYWASRGTKLPKPGEPKKPTKTERKKLRKQQKAEQAGAGAIEQKNGDVPAAQQTVVVNGRSKSDTNPHIRCSYDEVPISTIKNVLDLDNKRHTMTMPDSRTYILPFLNAKYRTRVRVVDFSPKQLEDFALSEPPDDGDKSENSVDWESSPKNEWSFSLLLEDATKPQSKAHDKHSNELWVNLGHEDAQYLFGKDMDDPTDLRNDSQLLAKLREKLCILWGNLEERTADDALSNRPFECCLMEYGVEMDEDDPERVESGFGFRRMYRMFGVTIL